jgi:hypothetical protein
MHGTYRSIHLYSRHLKEMEDITSPPGRFSEIRERLDANFLEPYYENPHILTTPTLGYSWAPKTVQSRLWSFITLILKNPRIICLRPFHRKLLPSR